MNEQQLLSPEQNNFSVELPPEIQDFENSLSQEFRNLLHHALAETDTEIITTDLPKNTLCLHQMHWTRRNHWTKYNSPILIEGVTFHDGKVTWSEVDWLDIKKRRHEIQLIRRVALRDVRNVIMTRWSFFEQGDLPPPRLNIDPRNLPDRLFHRQTLHTIMSADKDLLDQYLENRRRSTLPPLPKTKIVFDHREKRT